MERVTRHQRQLCILCLVQNVDVTRRDNLCTRDRILINAAQRFHGYKVVRPYLLQRGEESIPVRCDPHISREPRQCRTLDVPGSNRKGVRTRPLANYHGNVEPRNFESTEDCSLTRN